MPVPPEFASVCADFETFRQVVREAIASGGSNPAAAKLKEVAAFLDEQFAQFKKAYPEVWADIDKQNAQTLAKVDEQTQNLKKIVAQHEAAVQAAMAAKNAAPPKEEIVIDRELGATLRTELLEKYGIPKKASEESVDPLRKVWQDWQEWDKGS